MAKYDFTQGSRVEVKTTFGEELKGEVFCYDKYTDTLVLKEADDGLRMLSADCILGSGGVVETKKSPGDEEELPAVDMARCEAREAKAIKAAEEAAQRIGVGVTKEGQAMFDAISRTMPVRWDGTSIVVLDEVRITPPYSAADAVSSPESKAALERVKLVIDFERAKLVNGAQ